MPAEFSSGNHQSNPREQEPKPVYKPEGSIVPLITPAIKGARDNVSVDIASLRKLLDHQVTGIGSYSGGIFVLGSQGEFRNLSYEQKLSVITSTADYLKDSLPLLVGISAQTTDETELLARFAALNHASALVIAPLYGQGDPIEKVAAASKVNVPVVLYNNPPIHSGSNHNIDLSIELISEIRKRFPNVVGLKDSTSNPNHLREVLGLTEINILHGSTNNARNNWGNAQGGVFAFANVYPKEAAQLIEQIRQNPEDQESRNQLNNLRQGLGNPSEIKTALQQQGIIKSNVTFGQST